MEEDMLPAKGCLETKAFIEEMAQEEHQLMKRAFERERRIVQLNQADRFARRFGKKDAYRFEKIEVESTAFYKENNLKIDFQLAVHQLRKDQQMSQEQFAEAVGMKVSRLKRIEKGEVLPQMNEIITLATVFDKAISFRLQ